MGALDHPAAADLDRCWDAPGGDLADHAALDQDLPTRLVVVAGIKVHHRLGGQRPDRGEDAQRHRQQPVVTLVGRGRHPLSGRPPAWVTVERLRPWLRRSTGLGRRSGRRRVPWSCTVHGQLLQLQAEQPIGGGQHQQA
jgi:hypothetical protein